MGLFSLHLYNLYFRALSLSQLGLFISRGQILCVCVIYGLLRINLFFLKIQRLAMGGCGQLGETSEEYFALLRPPGSPNRCTESIRLSVNIQPCPYCTEMFWRQMPENWSPWKLRAISHSAKLVAETIIYINTLVTHTCSQVRGGVSPCIVVVNCCSKITW